MQALDRGFFRRGVVEIVFGRQQSKIGVGGTQDKILPGELQFLFRLAGPGISLSGRRNVAAPIEGLGQDQSVAIGAIVVLVGRAYPDFLVRLGGGGVERHGGQQLGSPLHAFFDVGLMIRACRCPLRVALLGEAINRQQIFGGGRQSDQNQQDGGQNTHQDRLIRRGRRSQFGRRHGFPFDRRSRAFSVSE